jgi:hypothetical protein
VTELAENVEKQLPSHIYILSSFALISDFNIYISETFHESRATTSVLTLLSCTPKLRTSAASSAELSTGPVVDVVDAMGDGRCAVHTVDEFSTEPHPDDSLTEVLGSQAPEMRFSSSFHKGEPPVSKDNYPFNC